MTFYQSIIVILDVTISVLEILTLKLVYVLFSHPTVFWRPVAEERHAISTYSIHRWKVHLVRYNFISSFL